MPPHLRYTEWLLTLVIDSRLLRSQLNPTATAAAAATNPVKFLHGPRYMSLFRLCPSILYSDAMKAKRFKRPIFMAPINISLGYFVLPI